MMELRHPHELLGSKTDQTAAREQLNKESDPKCGIPHPHREALIAVRSALDTAVLLAVEAFGEDSTQEHAIALCGLLLTEADRIISR